MPPSIHPVQLISVLRLKSLTPAIIFLTSRRSCDEALQSFGQGGVSISPARREGITAVVDFPARTVVLTQSGVRRDQDFTDLSVAEVGQIAGRAGRRGKDSVGFAIVTPSPYMDLGVLVRGLTGRPEPLDSQFVISYPM